MSDLVLYTSDDGQVHIHLRVDGDTVWLTQQEIAELFQTTKQNVSLHIKNILEDGELASLPTVKESLTVQTKEQRDGQAQSSVLIKAPEQTLSRKGIVH